MEKEEKDPGQNPPGKIQTGETTNAQRHGGAKILISLTCISTSTILQYAGFCLSMGIFFHCKMISCFKLNSTPVILSCFLPYEGQP